MAITQFIVYENPKSVGSSLDTDSPATMYSENVYSAPKTIISTKYTKMNKSQLVSYKVNYKMQF